MTCPTCGQLVDRISPTVANRCTCPGWHDDPATLRAEHRADLADDGELVRRGAAWRLREDQ